MDKKLTLNDFVEINDSDNCFPKGFVVITSSDGKVLVKKKNMILKNGKDYLFYLFFKENSNIFADGSQLTDFSGYKLTKGQFGVSSRETEYSDNRIVTEDSDGNSLSKSFEITLKNVELLTINDRYAMKIVHTCNIDSTESVVSVQELGLYLTKENADDRLFSRIKFDPIPINANTEFTLEYYIYF